MAQHNTSTTSPLKSATLNTSIECMISPPARIAVITEYALNWEHGTGAQLLRLFDHPTMSFFHFYMKRFTYSPSVCPNSYLLEDSSWPGRRFSGVMRRLRNSLGRTWWNDEERINTKLFAALSSRNNFTCDLAYVVVGTEWGAAKAVSLIESLGNVSYMVHIMDIYDEQGLNPETMPGMRRLLEGASCVVALTQTIYEEVCRFAVRDVCKIPVGQELTSHIAQPLRQGETARCVVVGRPYAGGVQLLYEAYELMTRQFQKVPVEFLNLGAHISALPPGLRSVTHDLGQINDRDTYMRTLATCHIAYLSGPSSLDWLGRFSFPSRSSDYFMAGLPTVGCIASGTATEQELASLVPDAVQIVHTADALVTALNLWINNRDEWDHASKRVRHFAEHHLDINLVRQQVVQKINNTLTKVPQNNSK